MSTTAIKADSKHIKIELEKQFNTLIQTRNQPQDGVGNGIYTRYLKPCFNPCSHTAGMEI